MRSYDRSSPLIFIHVPKTAGTSVREVFARWYGDGLYRRYSDWRTNAPPVEFDMRSLRPGSPPVVIYGHIKRVHTEQSYLEVRQFVTILRDPFERAVSDYHFGRARASKVAGQSTTPENELSELMRKGDLSAFLRRLGPNGFLKYFPRPVTRENYRELIEEFFVEIGVMEHLGQSMHRIAAKLGMPFSEDWLPRLQVTPRDQESPAGLREEFMDRHALQYEVYNYVASRFAAG